MWGAGATHFCVLLTSRKSDKMQGPKWRMCRCPLLRFKCPFCSPLCHHWNRSCGFKGVSHMLHFSTCHLVFLATTSRTRIALKIPNQLVYSILGLVLVTFLTSVSLTQTRITWGKEASFEELPQSDWPMCISVRHFLMANRSRRAQPTMDSKFITGQGGMGYIMQER